ncbi:metallophosphoesterase [Aegicerativicinus sediminis]
MLRWIILFVIVGLFNFYTYQALKTITKQSWVHYLYIIIAIIVIGNVIIQFSMGSEGKVLSPAKSYAFGFLLAFTSISLIVVPILLGEDILRFLVGLYDKITNSSDSFAIPSRRKFISQIALALAAIPFGSLLYGMYKGKYNFKVLSYELYFEDLPDAFDGYRITQISDLHSGSFENREKIRYAVDLINRQESDVILFTGDMVNNLSTEMNPWKNLFSQLSAPDGVFSILGNHDYGDYVDWDTTEAKDQNFQEVVKIHKELGYDLLLNEHRFLQRNGDRIAIIGVENWGAGGFRKSGDIDLASNGVHKDDFKILMSHDPSHWSEVVLKHDTHYHLTLSGHTHGMQFGIEIPGLVKWSPVKWRYRYWAGIYKELGQYINVNRGFGYLGYPGRVGIWPEITVIELKKGSNDT